MTVFMCLNMSSYSILNVNLNDYQCLPKLKTYFIVSSKEDVLKHKTSSEVIVQQSSPEVIILNDTPENHRSGDDTTEDMDGASVEDIGLESREIKLSGKCTREQLAFIHF